MNRARGLLCLLLALFLQVAWADRVVPSNHVENHLVGRAEPKAGSAPVGRLEPGDSARLVASVPYWYEISLDNGTPEFVSKAWSLVVPEPAPAATATDSIR